MRIFTATHEVEVEAAGAKAEALTALALELWRDTRDSKLDAVGGAMGFHTELSRSQYDTESSTQNNICPARAECNIKKGARTDYVAPGRRENSLAT